MRFRRIKYECRWSQKHFPRKGFAHDAGINYGLACLKRAFWKGDNENAIRHAATLLSCAMELKLGLLDKEEDEDVTLYDKICEFVKKESDVTLRRSEAICETPKVVRFIPKETREQLEKRWEEEYRWFMEYRESIKKDTEPEPERCANCHNLLNGKIFTLVNLDCDHGLITVDKIQFCSKECRKEYCAKESIQLDEDDDYNVVDVEDDGDMIDCDFIDLDEDWRLL